MNEDGSINENGGKYAGLSGMEARKQIVKDLEDVYKRQAQRLAHLPALGIPQQAMEQHGVKGRLAGVL